MTEQTEIESLRSELADVRKQLVDVRQHCAALCTDLAEAVRQSMAMQKETIAQIQQMQAEFLMAVAAKCDDILRLDEYGNRSSVN